MSTRHFFTMLSRSLGPLAVVCLLTEAAGAQHLDASGDHSIATLAIARTNPRPVSFVLPSSAERRPLKLSIEWIRTDMPDAIPAQERASTERSRPAWRIVLGAALGGVGGFFGGGYLGARMEGDGCHCDDPGLKGVLIGAPIGAAVGAIVGGRYFWRLVGPRATFSRMRPRPRSGPDCPVTLIT